MRLEALDYILALLHTDEISSKPLHTTENYSFTLKSLILSAELQLLSGALGLQALGPLYQDSSEPINLLHYQVGASEALQ